MAETTEQRQTKTATTGASPNAPKWQKAAEATERYNFGGHLLITSAVLETEGITLADVAELVTHLRTTYKEGQTQSKMSFEHNGITLIVEDKMSMAERANPKKRWDLTRKNIVKVSLVDDKSAEEE